MAIYAPPMPDGSGDLGIELKYHIVLSQFGPRRVSGGLEDYSPPLRIPRSEIRPTIAAWQFPRLPEELKNADLPIVPQEPEIVPQDQSGATLPAH